jgi:Flp pilus assembly protein TadG
MLTRLLRRDDEGAVAILVAAAAVLIFALAALAVDIGNSYSRRRETQTVADLAALAGGRQLPDVNSAFACAAKYLQDNFYSGAGGQSLSDNGGTANVAQLATELADGNEANGEIYIYDAPPGTAGATDLAPTSGVTGDDCGTATGGGHASTIRVVTPPARVNYGIANAIGVKSNHALVDAGATVTLHSLGDIEPFGLPIKCEPSDYGTLVTIKTQPPSGGKGGGKGGGGGGDDGSCGESTGDFGFLNLTWGGAQNNLEQALRNGADHGYGSIPVQPLEPNPPLVDEPCPADGLPFPLDTTYTYRWDQPQPSGTPNCVQVETGNVAQIITDAWIRSNSESCTDTGRMTRFPAGVTDTRSFDPGGGGGGSCTIDGRRLTDFTGGQPISDALLRGTGGAKLDNSIVDSPNFMVIPVLYTLDRPQNANKWWRIVDFVGLYLDYSDAACNSSGACSPYQTNGSQVYDDKGQITGVTGYLINLDAIQNGPNTGNVHDYFLGKGPAAPALVRDRLN